MSDPTPHAAPPDVNADGTGYDIFLSYNSRDAAEVQAVRQHLLDRGVKTFYDRRDLHLGRMWFAELQDAVERSRAVAVFVGPSGIGTWQKREMALALDRQAKADDGGGRFPVIPVLLPGSEIEEAPGLLLLNTWLDLRRGLDASEALDALARAQAGAAAETPAAPPLPPYRDLRAFREEDAPLFFGREVFARELLEKTKAHDLVAVVGPSGSGKSSVVQAGLLPLLRRQPPPFSGWDAVTFTPGANPFHNLAFPFVSLWERGADRTSLVIKAGEMGDVWAKGAPLALAVRQALEASGGTTDKLLVVADQFEELFTLTPEALRRPFLEALLAASKLAEVTVLLTLRADFYGQAVGFSRELSDLMQRGQVNLGPMTREELQRSIEEPARHVGLGFEPGLVKRILDHVEEQPGSLPLLEFALTELWQRWKKRRGGALSNQDYDEIGGVEGAASQRADAELSKLSAAEADGLLRFMTRLVRVSAAGEEGADTRQRATLKGLDEKTAAAVERFVRARLLVKGRHEITDRETGADAGEETVEVAHEALIRKWPRLRELLDKDRAFLLWRQRLRLRLDEYERTGRDAGTLLAGAPLKEALKFLRERPGDLSAPEREYIEASDRAAREREQELKRAVSRPKVLAVAAAAAVLVLAVVGLVSYRVWLNSDARHAALIREDAARQAENFKPETVNKWLAALALSGDVDRALAAARDVREPNSPALALSSIASTLARAGKSDEARRAVEEAAKAAPAEPKNLARAAAFASIARTRLALGQKEEARPAAAAAADAYQRRAAKPSETRSGDSDSNHSKGKEVVSVLLKTDQTELARTVIYGSPESTLRVVNLPLGVYACRELIKQNRLEEAMSFADGPFPDNWTKLSFLDSLLQELKKANKADDARRLAARAAAEASAAGGRIGTWYLTKFYLEAGDAAAATQAVVKNYSSANRHSEQDAGANHRFIMAAAWMAKVGRLDEALEGMERRFQGEKLIRAYAMVVEALDELDQREEARRVAEKAAALIEAARLEDEASLFRSSTELISTPASAQTLVRILAESGRLELARKLFRGTLQYRFGAVLPVQVPRALFKEGKVDEALALAGEALSADEPSNYDGVAALYVKAGRSDEFHAAAARAGKNRGEFARMLLGLAMALIEVGEGEKAKEAVDKALAEAGRADSGGRLLLLALAAKAQARLGLLREGQETVKDCPPDDKLEFYSIAVIKYAGLKDDRLVKALEPDAAEVGQDEDE